MPGSYSSISPRVGISKLLIVACAALAFAQDKRPFRAPAASTLAARQTVEKVTIGVEPYEKQEKMKEAFGKADPSKLGVLPILVVIANDSDHALQLERLRVQFITQDRQPIEPVPAEDLQLTGVPRGRDGGVPPSPPRLPIPGRRAGSGNNRPRQKDIQEFSAREFVAPVVASHSSASGFFYFRLGKGPDRLPGARLYITGIRDAQTGQDLLYFEINLDDYRKGP